MNVIIELTTLKTLNYLTINFNKLTKVLKYFLLYNYNNITYFVLVGVNNQHAICKRYYLTIYCLECPLRKHF